MSKKKNNLKSNKVLYGMSLFQLRAATVAMAFGIIGIWTYLLTSAASYNVRFVLFCGNEQSSCGSVSTLDSDANAVRSYYGWKLNRTFTKVAAVQVRGTQNSSYYNGSYDPNGSDAQQAAATNTTISRIEADLKAIDSTKYGNPYTKVVVRLGFRSMGHCGVGRANGIVGVEDPFICTSESARRAVMTHELGHTFGLASCADKCGTGTTDWHRADNSLMDKDYACGSGDFGDDSCPLNSYDRSLLLNSRAYWFPNAVSSTTTTTSTSSPYVETGISTYGCTMVPHTTVDRGDSGGCVSHLQWILVHKKGYNLGTYGPNGDGVDGSFGTATYNAVVSFQKSKGLTADGIVGPKTWDALH